MGLEIDDFGTGYSSFSYLKRFPVDTLKIDKSFVSGLGAGVEDAAIAQAIVNVVHTLGLKATAEGVETQTVLPGREIFFPPDLLLATGFVRLQVPPEAAGLIILV